MKKLLLMIIAMSFIASSAFAGSGKSGYVDTQMVLEKTKEGQRIQNTLREYAGSREKILKMDDEEIQKLIEEYKKQESAMSDKGKAEKREIINRKDAELQKKARGFNEELRKKQEEMFKDFDQKTAVVVKEIAKKERMDMVISKSVVTPQMELKLVLYADEGLDLTEKVIAEMDKKEEAKK